MLLIILSGVFTIILYKVNIVTNGVSFENELNRVIVHGVLHLCGYKDKSVDEEKLMRSKEDFYLDRIVPRET